VWPGQAYPRGATWDGEGVNFSLFSENSEKVELCIFDSTGRHEIQRIEVRERTDGNWNAYLPEARPGFLYGYRVYGPYDPGRGHRFNPNKLLIEPYAKALHGSLVWSDAHFGYRTGSSKADLSFDRRDSAPTAACWPTLPAALPVRRTCTKPAVESLMPASTSSPRTTASRSRTW